MNFVYVREAQVRTLHRRFIVRYGGAPGIRDEGALESALAQPKMAVFGCERFPTLADKTAAYCYFLIRNHAFIDGNKRLGAAVAELFLRANGVIVKYESHDALRDTMLAVAAGEIGLEELSEFYGRAIAGGAN